MLHIALTIILVGACVTHFFGEQGDIHLRMDKAVSLPINHSNLSLFLWDFQIVYDGENPVDYISELRLLDRNKQPLVIDEGTLRMNKPLKYHYYRFCQSDYDSDERGVVLSYNYDPWGIGITYTGYALLLVTMIAFFFQKQSRFRAVLHSLSSRYPSRWTYIGFGVLAILIIVPAIVMTHVVTPKPPLQPVLQTPLLGIHVSVIMLSYTLFAIIAVLGIVGLCAKKLSIISYQLSIVLLYPALFCLTAGIFIGAIWANMSWGRYWGWDPKETWALITMLVYALLLHLPWLESKVQISNLRYKICHHICCIVAFLFVLFTYFGVSYLLGGLHSYA